MEQVTAQNELKDWAFGQSGRNCFNRMARDARLELEATLPRNLSVQINEIALGSAEMNLAQALQTLSLPCINMQAQATERVSRLLFESIIVGSVTHPLGTIGTPKRFYQAFPDLAELQSELIRQWKTHITEIVRRFARDRACVSKRFFRNRTLSKITNLQLGLSDRHNNGRSVALLFIDGQPIIYKPRSGDGERQWLRITGELNRLGITPGLMSADVVCRTGYCWMEYIRSARCPSGGALERFHQRLGSLIAVAHFMHAVDFHKENLVAMGEHPIVIDAETLWHPNRPSSEDSPTSALARTGLAVHPADDATIHRDYCVIAPDIRDKLRIQMGNLVSPVVKPQKIREGFQKTWNSIQVFKSNDPQSRDLHQLRRIYRSTNAYARIINATLQPSMMTSTTARSKMISRLCRREILSARVNQLECEALQRLDIPHFTEKRGEHVERSNDNPSNVTRAVSEMLRF